MVLKVKKYTKEMKRMFIPILYELVYNDILIKTFIAKLIKSFNYSVYID